jgi:hypothetical protein
MALRRGFALGGVTVSAHATKVAENHTLEENVPSLNRNA